MSKIGRNDPCPCGSGKKFKKCCGENNVIDFNFDAYNIELNRLQDELIHFALTNFEQELIAQSREYVETYLGEVDKEEFDLYMGLITAWLIIQKPIEYGDTIFDIFYEWQQNKPMLPRTKKVLSSWRHVKPSVYQITSVTDGQIMIQDVLTNQPYEFMEEEITKEQIGNFIVGVFLPYVETSKIFTVLFELPKNESAYIHDLFDYFDINDAGINDVFPEFLAMLINSDQENIIIWTDPNHEMTANLLAQHLHEKNFHEVLITAGILMWNIYCERQNPRVQKPGTYAAAIEYYLHREIIGDPSVTQAQIGQEYFVSAGTVSTYYRRLVYVLDDLDIPELFQEIEEEIDTEYPEFFEDEPHFNMEKEMRHISTLLEEQEFDSDEELTEFLGGILDGDELPPISETPRDLAQDMLDDAEFLEGEEQLDLIKMALERHPNSPTAYVLLAERETSQKKRLELLEKAVKVGETDLGSDFFKENKGYFWGIVDTRPYMRAKARYAVELQNSNHLEAAVEQFEQLITLNTNDNQGIRDMLLPLYIQLDLYEQAFKLLDQYENDISATFMFNRALLTYLTEGMSHQAHRLLQKANEQNPFVLDYLLKRKRVPKRSYPYISLGEESEAVVYAQNNLHLWDDAVDFLRSFS